MNFHLIIIAIILQTSLLPFISAPYPKYYINNYCGNNKGSVLNLGTNGKSSVALLKLKRETYKPNLDCDVTIKAPLNHGVIALIKRIKLRRFRSHQDYLEVISDNNMTSLKWFGNNEEIIPKKYLISNPSKGEINVIFKSENFILSLSNKGFKIVLTTFTRKIFEQIITYKIYSQYLLLSFKVSQNGICRQNSSLGFNCQNKICVDRMLECDGINNCMNYIDEENCSAGSETMIGPVVFGLTILVMVVLIILFICKTDKEKRENMARRFSKACINSGRRLSTIFTTERRVVPSPELINQKYKNDPNIYRSVPIIYESNDAKKNDNRLKSGPSNKGIEVVNISTKRSNDNISVTECQSTENI